MAKYHINSKGNPSPCRATKGKCPFGGADQHFGSRQEAFAEAERRHEHDIKAEKPQFTPEDGFYILFRNESPRMVEEGVARVDKNGVNQHYLRKEYVSGDRIFVEYLDEDGQKDCDGTFPSCTIYSKPVVSGEKPKRISETYSVHGVMYREGDLPSHLVWNKDGQLVSQTWTNEYGDIERAGDKPAKIEVTESDNIIESYWRGGQLGRDGDKPDVVMKSPSGNILREEWHRDSVLHRVDGPAEVTYFDSGQVESEEWWQDGAYARADGGPTVTVYHENGKPEVEQYLSEDGVPYRDDGGATWIEYDASGNIVHQDFTTVKLDENIRRQA